MTKQEIDIRRSHEVKAASDKVRPPNYLSRELKKEFKKIANELLTIGIMTNLDIDALARFLLAQKMYLDITEKLLEIDPIVTYEVHDRDKEGNIINSRMISESSQLYSDLLINQDKLFKQCRAASSDLGLTISSRCRLVIPKKEEDKTPTQEENMFGDV